MTGPTLGHINTGLAFVVAADEPAARQLMGKDPAIASGLARGELRPFRVASCAVATDLRPCRASGSKPVDDSEFGGHLRAPSPDPVRCRQNKQRKVSGN